MKILVLSIKPKYLNLILSGEKNIELRKCKPSIDSNKLIVALYSTSPVKAIVGFCLINEIIDNSPDYVWKKYGQNTGLDKENYFNYYSQSNKAIGLKLDNIFSLKNNISLDEIRQTFSSFHPPQTFKYYDFFNLKEKFEESLTTDTLNILDTLYKKRKIVNQ